MDEKKQPKTKKKLEISSETLRDLEGKELDGVAGGNLDCTCGGCYCTKGNTTCAADA